MMKGEIYPRSNIYMLNLTQRNKLMMQFTTPDNYCAGSVYRGKSKGTLVYYHHSSFWRPTQYWCVKSITKKSSLPGQAYHLTLCKNTSPKNHQPYLGTFNNMGNAYNQHRKRYSSQNQIQNLIQNKNNFPHPCIQKTTILYSSRQWI